MNERQRFIIKTALIYAQANLDDLNEAFQEDASSISVNGTLGKLVEENEVEELLFQLQD